MVDRKFWTIDKIFMLSRIFGKPLPGPTEEQSATDLETYELARSAEVTSIAIEPRYKLIAFGNSIGRLYVINQDNQILASKDGAPTAICRLYSCPNTSSFVSVYSQYTYNNHPNQLLNIYDEGDKNSFKNKRHFRSDSVVAHWVVTEDRIIPRIISLKENIVELVVSPSTPNFAMILMSTGALLGFSLEKMKFTDFYVNIFEGKLVKALSCPLGMTYYIAHDEIETLDIDSMEVDKYSSQSIQEFDYFDDYAAAIGVDGIPRVIKGNKTTSTQKLEEGEKAIYTTMIESEKQFTIIRSDNFDSIMIGSRRISLPDGVRLAPGVAVEYGKSFFDRNGILSITVISTDGKFYKVNDVVEEFPLFPPFFDFEKCISYEYDDTIYVAEKIDDNSFNIHTLKRNGYVGVHKIDAVFPKTFKEGKFVCISPLAIDIVDTNKFSVTRVVEGKEKVRAICYQNTINVFYDQFPQLRSQDMTTFVPTEGTQEFSPSFGDDVQHALFVQGKECFIMNDNSIIYNGDKYEGFDKDDQYILIDCINEQGRADPEGQYLLVLTKKLILLFDAADGMKKIRRDKNSDNIERASILAWGGLLMCSKNFTIILPLPDFTLKHLGKLALSNDYSIVMIENYGLIASDSYGTVIYSNNHIPPRFVDLNTAALAIPQKKSFFGLINKNTAPTTEEADEKFGFKRSKATSSVSKNISETGQMMQELLVIAQQRSEKLNELEDKANRIHDHARAFHEACMKLKK